MIDQHQAIEASKGPGPFAAGASFKPWHFYLLILLMCVGCGVLSVALGPDNYWDLRYYHLYAPWAYLHGRYQYDIGPAQEQGFLNPTADFLLYGLISSPLNDFPRVVPFIMGAVHGINAALLFAIACHVLRPLAHPSAWCSPRLPGMGVSGAGFVSLLRTTSNDLTSSLFVLGSVLGILKVAEPKASRESEREKRPQHLARLCRIGTMGRHRNRAEIHVGRLHTRIGCTRRAAVRRRTVGGLVAFGLGALLGFLAVAGHHMLALWQAFGNPTFPYLKHIFHSPYWESEAVRDARFLPQDFLHLFFYPFYWTTTDTYIVAEPAFRDWRAAIAEVAMAAGVLALAARCVRNGCRRDGVTAQTPGLDLVFIFVVVSYFAWVLGFAYYRYAIPLEMLTGVVTMGALIWLFDDRRLRVVTAIVLLAVASTTTFYLDWGRGRYGDRYVDPRAAIAEEQRRADCHLGPGGVFHSICRAERTISGDREQLSGTVPGQQARIRGETHHADARTAEVRPQR
jgi:hypothetical protein